MAFGATDPSILTKEITDTTKSKLANPLSKFLQSDVGKGLPAYTGELSPSVNKYNEFLGVGGDQPANALFDKYVAGPQTEAFKRDFLPLLNEGYAGSLRGSGRFRSEEDVVNRFSQDLAGQRYTANKEMAQTYYNIQDTRIQRQYQDWFKSLPENNPALKSALDFLSQGTETGKTVLSALDPGKQGWMGDLIKGAAVVGAAFIPGIGPAASAGLSASFSAGSSGGVPTSDWFGGSA